jgi:hypothetical protein
MRSMATAAALFLSSAVLGAQVEIRSLTGTIEGHEVGGVTIDMIGNVYAADFGDNAIDSQGNLLRARMRGCRFRWALHAIHGRRGFTSTKR